MSLKLKLIFPFSSSSSSFSHFRSNQEELERVKKDIEEQKRRRNELEIEADRTMVVLQSIKEALVEMLLKLQEVDEVTTEIQVKGKISKPVSIPLPDLFSGNMSTEQIVKLLEEKVKAGMIASGQLLEGYDSGLEVEEVKPRLPLEELFKIDDSELLPIEEGTEKPPKSPSVLTDFGIDEKPASYPQVYSSLITGRSTGLVSSASPGAGGPGGSEEEADVPSRSFLKRQAHLILDAKSRRKFRPPPPTGRRK